MLAAMGEYLKCKSWSHGAEETRRWNMATIIPGTRRRNMKMNVRREERREEDAKERERVREGVNVYVRK